MALSTSNLACTPVMIDKARIQSIEDETLPEALHLARYAVATRVVGEGEPVFDPINERRVAAAGDREG